MRFSVLDDLRIPSAMYSFASLYRGKREGSYLSCQGPVKAAFWPGDSQAAIWWSSSHSVNCIMAHTPT